MGKKEKLIDITKIFSEKKPKLYKFTPKFLVRKFEKKLHQEEMNDFVESAKHEQGQAFVREIVNYFEMKIKFAGLENIPKDKPYVFVGNHPLGALDGIAFLNIVHHFFGKTKAIINDLLLKIKNLKPVAIGVNVYGKFHKKHIEELDNLYKSNEQIVIFPAGLVSRKIKGKIIDLEWKKSFLTKAINNKRDVIPVFIEAKNSNFFYNFAQIRKFSGIKFNFELVFLPDEAYKFKGKEILFKFGEPISYKKFTKDKNIKHWVNYVREKTYELKAKTFDNIYDFEATAETTHS